MQSEVSSRSNEQTPMADRFRNMRNEQLLPEGLVTLMEGVLSLTASARAQARIVLPPREDMAPVHALFAGSPLLLRQDFPCDMKQALGLIPELLDLLESSSAGAAKAAAALRAALAPGGGLDAAVVLRALAAGDETPFAPWRQAFPDSPRALDFVATCALAPSLAAAAELLAPLLPEDLPHEHGGCPLCGSPPYVSLLHGKEGRRMGVCSFCGHEHRIRRIACAYCDESEQNRLKQFRVQEYPGMRVDVCDTCKTYIKTLDYREQDGDRSPSLDDLATVELDIMARQQGYSRPVLYAWGF